MDIDECDKEIITDNKSVTTDEVEQFFEITINSLDLEQLVYDTFYDYMVYEYYGLIPFDCISQESPVSLATKSDLKLINKWNDYYFGRKQYGRKD